MTVPVMIGLLLQLVAATIIHFAIKGRWLDHLGALFAAMAILGHGLTELIQWIWPGRNTFRALVSQAAIDNWVVLVSVAILLYAVTYAALILLRRRTTGEQPTPQPARYIARLRLPWLLLLTAPLLIATARGQGVLAPRAVGTDTIPDNSNYLISGLATQYLLLLTALTGVVVVARRGRRWLLPVFLAQAVLLALAGIRSMIVIAAVLTILGIRLAGVRPSRRQLALIVAVAGFFIVTISASRATDGRTAFLADQGTGGRLTALTDGVTHLTSPGNGQAILSDLAYRFDDNSYGAMVLQSLKHGYQPVGLATVRNDVLLGVPSALQPDKLDSSVETRNEEQYVDVHMGLNPAIDYLTSVLGTIVAYYGPWGLPIAAILIAVAFAAAEAVISKAASPTRLILAVGLAQCVMLYESGPVVYITIMRGFVLLAALVWIIRGMLNAANRRGEAPGVPATLEQSPPRRLEVIEDAGALTQTVIRPRSSAAITGNHGIDGDHGIDRDTSSTQVIPA
ncbi:hypothetical protein [Rugosimonospora africana]|uniref:Uncharacterized protein n=1 Tax=Rugosimonospora africana TaxID=556532 RepID=A0A8J3QLY0_9ACTN|nr:hypothetical protein [Rugosimonospora africana]GIH13379.1 hypothetical protein Raf01_15510 [Rugosimonospora africana]